MFNLKGVANQVNLEAFQANLSDYSARTAGGVEILAEGCGMDAARERARFEKIRASVAKVASGGKTDASFLSQVMRGLANALPDEFELVLVYRGEGPIGFGYITAGSSGPSLPANMAQLLQSTLELFLLSGGDTNEAQTLTNLFALAFPEPAQLEPYSPNAQGILTAFIPAGERLRLKAYYNTRINPVGEHRAQVGKMMVEAGVCNEDEALRLYDALYTGDARFRGVGADFDGDGKKRAKMYVRVDTARALDHIARVGEAIGATDLSATEIFEQFPEAVLADEVEVGIAARDDGARSVKVTLFFPGKGGADPVPATIGFLKDNGYDPSLAERAIAGLRAPNAECVVRMTPVHGVGIELPDAAPRKVNLYLQPAL